MSDTKENQYPNLFDEVLTEDYYNEPNIEWCISKEDESNN